VTELRRRVARLAGRVEIGDRRPAAIVAEALLRPEIGDGPESPLDREERP